MNPHVKGVIHKKRQEICKQFFLFRNLKDFFKRYKGINKGDQTQRQIENYYQQI